MKFRLELRDTNFNILEILDNEFLDLNWSYSRIGGCGEFSFRLPRKLFEEKSISGDFNIRIYSRADLTGTYELWYQGLIENKTPSIRGNSEDIAISGHGYIAQLSRIYFTKTYTSQEISVIVKDILDNYVTPNTDVTYSVSDITATTFTPDTLEFNTDALTAIQTCADIVGSREWGVDKDRKFFFKARSSSIGRRFFLGQNINNYSEDQDFKSIINRVIVQGANVSGVLFSTIYNHTQSQDKYNIRSQVKQNSAITTNTVAAQFATSIFAEFSDVVRRCNFDIVGLDARLEATNPVDLITVIGKEIAYGERKYGTFLYSGYIDRIINRINYKLSNNNSLSINIDAGQLRPTLSEELSQLEFNLEQTKNANL